MPIVRNKQEPVKFYLKNPSENTSPIKAVFCYNTQQFYYYERKLSVATKDWDKKLRRAKESGKNKLVNQQLNSKLNNISNAIYREYNNYKLSNNQKEPTLNQLRTLVKKARGSDEKSKETSRVTLFSFIQEYLENEIPQKLNSNTGKPIAQSTIIAYNQSFKYLKEYAKKQNNKPDFEDIDMRYYYGYLKFLKEDANLKLNTIGKHIRNLKSFLKASIKFHSNNIYLNPDFRVISENAHKVYLTREEFKCFEEFDLEGNARLEKVRDFFRVGVYTGLRYSDYSDLHEENIKLIDDKKFIQIEQKKTGKVLSIAIAPELELIFDHYRETIGSILPKAISIQKFNGYLNEICCKIPELQEEIKVPYLDDKKKRKFNIIRKCDEVTSHTARRTLITWMYEKGMPTYKIMSVSGHTSEKNLRRYLRLTDMEKAIKVSEDMINFFS